MLLKTNVKMCKFMDYLSLNTDDTSTTFEIEKDKLCLPCTTAGFP